MSIHSTAPSFTYRVFLSISFCTNLSTVSAVNNKLFLLSPPSHTVQLPINPIRHLTVGGLLWIPGVHPFSLRAVKYFFSKIIHLIWLSGNNSLQQAPKSNTCTIFSSFWLRNWEENWEECWENSTWIACTWDTFTVKKKTEWWITHSCVRWPGMEKCYSVFPYND